MRDWLPGPAVRTVDHMSEMTTIRPAVAGDEMAATARNLGPALREVAARHDLEGSFVADAYDRLREVGYLAAPVPVELGGGGATTAQVAWAQHEMARWCGSTALATTMHLHVVLANAWRYRKGMDGAEALLRRVAADGVVVASTGGGDFTIPSGIATKVDGGWKVTGRKAFVSGSPAAALASMWAMTEDGEAIAFGASMSDPCVQLVETWDAPGMRGTASHDVVLDGVFVADDKITGRRAPSEFAPVLAILAAKALTVIAATYLGVAQGARDEVVARLTGTGAASDPGTRRRIGEMDAHLRTATWALQGAFAELGEDPDPTPATFVTGTSVKRTVIELARSVGDLAMDTLGGRAYRRGDAVERAWRDLRAGTFHPLDHELTLRIAGDLALGRDLDLR